jgi:hypothetical protein
VAKPVADLSGAEHNGRRTLVVARSVLAQPVGVFPSAMASSVMLSDQRPASHCIEAGAPLVKHKTATASDSMIAVRLVGD